MSDKEKAAREYSADYEALVPINRTWAQISDTITLVSRESFLAGAEWAAPKWIKCSERLPELNQLVLTWSYDKKMDWGHMTHQHWWEVCRDGMEHVEVTHWMEIPEAPKEEE